MLIKALKNDRVLFCGHISPSEAIRKYPDSNLYYLVNELADPTLKTDKGAIAVRDSNFGSAEWIFLEFDKELPEFPCEPTKIIESSPGRHHVYWRVPELSKLGLEQVKLYFKALSNHYGTDLTKPLQMMRLPGSLNHKYNPPVPVKLISENTYSYTLDQLFEGITVESPKEVKPSECHQFVDYLVNTFLLNKLNLFFPFPATNHNNHLNKTAFIIFRDWANLVGRDHLIGMMTRWANANSHLPSDEINTVLSKFRDGSRYPSRWFFEDNSEPDLEYKKSISFAYQSMLRDLATYTDAEGKEKQDPLLQATIKNWFMRRLLANVGYSPRCNYYLDSEGKEITPYKIAVALEGWLIGSAIKEERRVYGLLESNHIEPVTEYFKRLPKVSTTQAEATLRELLQGVMGLSQIDYIQARKWLVLAAKRARWGVEQQVINPYCLLLKGQQGVGKSAFFEILGGKWNFSYVQDNESTLSMMGSLTVTLDEYDRFTNKGQSEIKNMISEPTDKVRQKYARAAVSLNRLYSFGGTTNSSEILKDPTGSRRFLIVTLPQGYRQPYDIGWLKRNRDLVWASALALAADEPIEFDEVTIKLIESLKENYEATAPQEQILREWLEGEIKFVNDRPIQYFPGTAYSYSEIAGIISPNGKLTPGEKSHLIDILLKLGWTRGAGYREGRKINWMVSPASDAAAAKPVESIL